MHIPVVDSKVNALDLKDAYLDGGHLFNGRSAMLSTIPHAPDADNKSIREAISGRKFR